VNIIKEFTVCVPEVVNDIISVFRKYFSKDQWHFADCIFGQPYHNEKAVYDVDYNYPVFRFYYNEDLRINLSFFKDKVQFEIFMKKEDENFRVLYGRSVHFSDVIDLNATKELFSDAKDYCSDFTESNFNLDEYNEIPY
jgi:hypothetical protein